jgi:Fic family protein
MIFKKFYAKLPALLPQQSKAKIQSVTRDRVFVSREWLLHDRRKTLAKVVSKLCYSFIQSAAHPYAPIFFKRAAIEMIYTSNKLERTLPPLSSSHDIYKILNDLYESYSDDLHAAPCSSWNAEGQNPQHISIQVTQHLRALKFLMQHLANPLTVEVVLKTHSVLMAGAVDDAGAFIQNGALRAHPSYAGTHVYPEGNPVVLRASLMQIVEQYNTAMKQSSPTLVEPASRLFYNTITLHPFQNGNGRLCRLLFAFAMVQAGVPFPVALTTRHSGARRHYMKSILLARRDDTRELATTALMSVDYTLSDFLENARLTDFSTSM